MSGEAGGGMGVVHSEQDRFRALVEAFIRQLAFFLGSGMDGKAASKEIISWMKDTPYKSRTSTVQRLLNRWRKNGTLDAISSNVAKRADPAKLDEIRGIVKPRSKWWKNGNMVTEIFAFTSGLGGLVADLAPEGCMEEMAAALGQGGFYDAKSKKPEKFMLASPASQDSYAGMTLVGVPGNWLDSESEETRKRGMRDYLVTLTMSYMLLFICSKMKDDEVTATLLS